VNLLLAFQGVRDHTPVAGSATSSILMFSSRQGEESARRAAEHGRPGAGAPLPQLHRWL